MYACSIISSSFFFAFNANLSNKKGLNLSNFHLCYSQCISEVNSFLAKIHAAEIHYRDTFDNDSGCFLSR